MNPCTSRYPMGIGNEDPHQWGDPVEHEERGILTITHGKRAGRVYSVERTWKERACATCGETLRMEVRQGGSEWPGSV